jgi:hypothetical protein
MDKRIRLRAQRNVTVLAQSPCLCAGPTRVELKQQRSSARRETGKAVWRALYRRVSSDQVAFGRPLGESIAVKATTLTDTRVIFKLTQIKVGDTEINYIKKN